MMPLFLISIVSSTLPLTATLLIKKLCDFFFQRNRNMNNIIWISYFIMHFILVYSEFSPLLLFLSHFILLSIVIEITYIGKIPNKILLPFLVSSALFLSNVLIRHILPFLFHEENISFLDNLFSEILFIIILIITNQTSRKLLNKLILEKAYLIRVIYVSFASLFAIYGIIKYGIFNYGSRTERDLIFITFSFGIVLSIVYVVFRLYERLNLEIKLRKQNLLYEQELKLYIDFLNEKKRVNKESDRIRHDWKNQLIFLYGLINSTEYEQAKKTMDKMLLEINIHKEISRTNCVLIDTLINYKYSLAVQDNIKFIVNTSPVISKEFDDMLELSIILGNVLDNAIEATKKINNPNDKIIELFIFENKGVLSIKIINNYVGDIKRDNNGNFKSSKMTDKPHGIGISSIKKAVEKNNGDISIDYKDNVFIVSILLYSERN